MYVVLYIRTFFFLLLVRPYSAYFTLLPDDLLLAVNAVFFLKGRTVSISTINYTTVIAFIYLELLDKRVVDLAAHGSKNALLTEGTVQDLLDGDSAWDTD